MKQDIFTLENKKASFINLDKSVFEAEVRPDIVHKMVLWQLAKRRTGSRKTLERGEITGSRAKMYRQKGTGRARHGEPKVSQFRGGGVAHGPRVRSHTTKLPKNLRSMAMCSILSSKVKEGNLLVIEDLSVKTNKTANLKQKLSKLPIGKSALFVSGNKVDENFLKALRNIPNFDVLPAIGANVYDILKRETLVLSKTSVDYLVTRLTKHIYKNKEEKLNKNPKTDKDK